MADRGRSPARGKTPSLQTNSRSASQGSKTPSPSRKSLSPRKLSPAHKADKSRKPSPKGKKSAKKDVHPPKTPPSRKGSSRKSQRSTPQIEKSPELTEDGFRIVNYSGQGMTSVPISLLSSKDIGELCLASNNLRSIPLEIRRLVNLKVLDLSRNGIRCNSAQDFGGLPAEMELLTELEELKISECNLPFIPPAIWKLTNLKYLDISRNKINVLLPEVGNLINLQKFNVQQTNISSLPPEIAFCQELEEILLWGNSIESLPETLPEMPKLRIMAINYRSFCLVVDDYMENLLKKGQIKSEHIPVVVFELPCLECLDLEATKLNNLPDVYNLALKEFYLCRNFLQTVPSTIYNLKYLSILDLSNNLMLHLPEDIGRLRCLRILRVSNNMFEHVPHTIGLLTNLEELNMDSNRIRCLPIEIKGLLKLKTLVLAHNDIRYLPDEICLLVELETLDLTDNSITHLPMKLYKLANLKVAHSYRKLHKHGLWLYKNPLEQPPPEVWRTERPEYIYDYLKKLAIIKTKNLQRQKIFLLGATQSGKTCLANVLAFKKSTLTNGEQDKTRVIYQMLWKTENNVEFMINDFGGDDVYHVTTPMFLDAKALILIVYDCAKFKEEDYRTAIGQWINLLNTQAPGAVVKIVATQCDLLEPAEEIETITEVENSKIDTDSASLKPESAQSDDSAVKEGEDVVTEDATEDATEANHWQPEDRASTTTSQNTPSENTKARFVLNKAQAQLKHYMQSVRDEMNRVSKEMIKVAKSMNTVSSDPANDVPEAALKLLTVRKNKLREILGCPVRILPEVSVVSSSDSLEGIAELVDEIEHLAIDRDLFPHAQRLIPSSWNRLCATFKKKKTTYLLWDEVEEIAKFCKIEEDELKDCMHYLNDIGDVLWYEDVMGLSEIVFHRPLKLVDILASLYRHDIEDFMDFDNNKIFGSKGRLTAEEFNYVRETFLMQGQVCRPLLNCLWFYQRFDNSIIEDLLELLPLLDLCYAVPEPSVPTCRLYKQPLMILPWYNRDSSQKSISEFWREIPYPNEKDLTVIYTFPLNFPVGLFQKMSAAVQDLVLSRVDWEDAVYATSNNEQILIQKQRQGMRHLVQLLIRGLEFSEIQELMQDFVQVINGMLIRFPGLYWTLDIPMKNMKFLSFVAKSPTIQFELMKTPNSFRS